MKARLVAFGRLEIDGTPYEHDIVIERGRIRRRKKGPSKPHRSRFGHTPLSLEEAIPWNGQRLVVGTGARGSLPVMPEVYAEAERRGVRIEALPTEEACGLLEGSDPDEVNAILHVTC